jgi:hypothetical protein
LVVNAFLGWWGVKRSRLVLLSLAEAL